MTFLIHGPEYNPKSGGVRALHYLPNLLQINGEDVMTTFACYRYFDIDPVRRCETKDVQLHRPEAVTIYPDCIRGNPLGAKRIVRFMLYYAGGHFGGDRIPKEELPVIHTDVLFGEVADHCDVRPTREHLMHIGCIEPGLFYAQEKTIESVFYRGKGSDADTMGMTLLLRDSHTREQAADLLRHARRFFTTDPYTVMSVEAGLAGCRSYVILGPGYQQHWEQDLNRWVMNLDRDKQTAARFAKLCREFFK